MRSAKLPVIGLLDDIRSMHNVGSMFRSSDGVNLRELILCGYTPVPPRSQISKVALGAELSVPWRQAGDPLEAVKELKRVGVQIVALETGEGAIDLFEFEPQWPMCLLVGNEVEGVKSELREKADVIVSIPMLGVKESLNVSCAYSIAVYELLRKWQKKTPQSGV